MSGLILSRFPGLFWRFRHWWDRKWTEGYTCPESLEHPHRDLILRTVGKYAPFRHLLEYGCGPGTNLVLLADRYFTGEFSESRFYGLDISRRAIEKAIRRPNIDYDTIDWFDWYLKNISFDIILTDACLIYMRPRPVKKVIQDFRNNSGVYIGCEWHSDQKPFMAYGHWVHNYRELFPGCTITRLTEKDWPDGGPGWREFGCLVEWVR